MKTKIYRLWVWMQELVGRGNLSGQHDNRRNFARVPCELPVELYCSIPGLLVSVPAVARNISRGGMRLQCSKFIPPKTLCQLSFTIPEWISLGNRADRSVMVEAQACYCDKHSGVYGFKFLQSLAS